MNKFDITCVTPEFPYCPLCPYGLVEPDDAEYQDDIKHFKVFCLLNDCYI